MLHLVEAKSNRNLACVTFPALYACHRLHPGSNSEAKNRMQITEFPARLSQHKRVLREIQGM